MNNGYLYETSCYDCMNCRYKPNMKNRGDNYCWSSCQRCYNVNPQARFSNMIWFNPNQFPYGNYYGSYFLPGLMY